MKLTTLPGGASEGPVWNPQGFHWTPRRRQQEINWRLVRSEEVLQEIESVAMGQHKQHDMAWSF